MSLDDRARKQVNDTIHALQDLMEDGIHEAQATGQEARRQIRSHPGASVGIALAAGLLIGLVLGRIV
ncbi:MAG: DUF883 family protein [Asticcacaulis sp.]